MIWFVNIHTIYITGFRASLCRISIRTTDDIESGIERGKKKALAQRRKEGKTEKGKKIA